MAMLIIEIVELQTDGSTYKIWPHRVGATSPFALPQEVDGYSNSRKVAVSMAKQFIRENGFESVEVYLTDKDGDRDLVDIIHREDVMAEESNVVMDVPKSRKGLYQTLTPDDYLPQDPNDPNPEWDEAQREAFKRFIQGD